MSTAIQGTDSICRPPSITGAFWLLIASGVLGIIATALVIASIFSPDGAASIRDEILSIPQAMEGELDTDALVAIGQATATGVQVVFALVAIVVTLWVALSLRAGRGYIRVVAAVFAVIQAIGVAVTLEPLSTISLVCVLTAVALSWVPASNLYVRATTAARRDNKMRKGIMAQ